METLRFRVLTRDARDPRAVDNGGRTGRRALGRGTVVGICGTGGGVGDCVESLFLLPPKRREPRIRVNIESICAWKAENMPFSLSNAKLGRDFDLSGSPPRACLCPGVTERLREAGGRAGELV